MKRTTILLADADRTAVQAIKERYGVSSDSDAIRLALRVLASLDNTRALLLAPTLSRPRSSAQPGMRNLSPALDGHHVSIGVRYRPTVHRSLIKAC